MFEKYKKLIIIIIIIVYKYIWIIGNTHIIIESVNTLKVFRVNIKITFFTLLRNQIIAFKFHTCGTITQLFRSNNTLLYINSHNTRIIKRLIIFILKSEHKIETILSNIESFWVFIRGFTVCGLWVFSIY